MGCEVIGPAAGVEQALRLIKETGELDAAVLDVNLNGVLSDPAADVLALRGVPCVLLTGYDSKSLPKVYVDLPLLEKPIFSQELLAAMAAVLRPGAVYLLLPVSDRSIWVIAANPAAQKRARAAHRVRGGVSKPCQFALCSDASVRYAEPPEVQGDPPCPASIRPNSAACLPA